MFLNMLLKIHKIFGYKNAILELLHTVQVADTVLFEMAIIKHEFNYQVYMFLTINNGGKINPISDRYYKLCGWPKPSVCNFFFLYFHCNILLEQNCYTGHLANKNTQGRHTF